MFGSTERARRAMAPSSSPGAPTRSSTSWSRTRSRDHLGNVLYYLPADLAIRGKTTFRADLLRSTVVGTDSQIFSKDPTIDQLRSRQRDARLSADRVRRTVHARPTWRSSMNGDPSASGGAVPIEPLASIPPPCPTTPSTLRPASRPHPPREGLQPVSSRTGPGGRALRPRRPDVARLPHFDARARATPSPTRPATSTRPSGAVLVRYVNDRSDQVGFQVDVALTGTVE